MAPVTVVKAVIAALDEQHSRTIYLPFYAHFTGLLALMPSFIRDVAQKVRDFILERVAVLISATAHVCRLCDAGLRESERTAK